MISATRGRPVVLPFELVLLSYHNVSAITGAPGASPHLGSVPVSADAVHAETVSTRRGRRVGEDVQTDGALQLLVGQETAI